jgi:electron transfer flavoprotein alpha subunit
MANDIWAVAELEGGALKSISLQLASKAAQLAAALGGQSAAIALGQGAQNAVPALTATGVNAVLVSDDAVYDTYLAQPAVDALANLIQTRQPKAVLLPVTATGRDVAGRLAARLGLGIEYNVVAADVADGEIAMVVSAFGGQMNVNSTFAGDGTRLILARQNAFAATKTGSGAATESIPAPTAPANGAKVSGPFGTEGATEEGHMTTYNGHPQYVPPPGRSNVEEAAIIVSGGRGVGGPEGFADLDALAKALGGAVGSSRPVTDDEWLPHHHHIGQTGRTVKPELYIACGISGAVQHQAGMQTSKYIIAINKDKDAPIFTFSDLGVVGDLKVVIPELTRLVQDYKASH